MNAPQRLPVDFFRIPIVHLNNQQFCARQTAMTMMMMACPCAYQIHSSRTNEQQRRNSSKLRAHFSVELKNPWHGRNERVKRASKVFRTSFVLIFIIINSHVILHFLMMAHRRRHQTVASAVLCHVMSPSPHSYLFASCVALSHFFEPAPPKPPSNQQLFVFCYCFCSFVHSFLFVCAVSPTLYSAFIYFWLSHSMCCCASTSDRNFSSEPFVVSLILFCASRLFVDLKLSRLWRPFLYPFININLCGFVYFSCLAVSLLDVFDIIIFHILWPYVSPTWRNTEINTEWRR